METETKDQLDLNKVIQIYTGGRGGIGTAVVAVAAVGVLGVGAYFLWKYLKGKSTGGALWILMQSFTYIPATKPTSTAGYWKEMHVLNNVPATTPTTSTAYWVLMHSLNSLPATTPGTTTAFWILMHSLNNLPATTAGSTAAIWVLMQSLNNLPAVTLSSTVAIWVLMQSLGNLPATVIGYPPGVSNVKIISYPSSINLNSPCNITVSFTYVGTAGSKSLHAAIGQQGAFGFDEKSAVNASVSVPNTTIPTTVTANVSIPTTGLAAGVYGLTAKVDAVESGIYSNVVTIIGSQTPIVTNVQITNYPTSLNPGAACNITIGFTYVGPATTLSAHTALGQQGALGFDEKSAVNVSVSVAQYTNPTQLTFNASIPTTALASGVYGLTAKVNGVESGVLQNVVTIIGSTTPVITNVRITNYPTGNITPGNPINITVAYDYMGPATSKAFHAALGIQGALSFDEISGCTVDLTISIAESYTNVTRYFTATIPTKTTLSTGVYDMYCKLGGVQSPIYNDVIHIQAAVTPTLTIADDTLVTGDTLNFSFTGFQPNASVSVYVVGGGGLNITANSSGAGSGSFQIGENPGTYTLKAQDSYGHSATDTFTVTAPTTPTITNVRIENIPAYVTAGNPINVKIYFDYIGAASVKAFHAALGVKGLISFDEISGCIVDSSISIPAVSTVTTFSFDASIPTKTGLSGYKDLYCKLGGVFSPYYLDKVYIL
jgi:hypothetical protein